MFIIKQEMQNHSKLKLQPVGLTSVYHLCLLTVYLLYLSSSPFFPCPLSPCPSLTLSLCFFVSVLSVILSHSLCSLVSLNLSLCLHLSLSLSLFLSLSLSLSAAHDCSGLCNTEMLPCLVSVIIPVLIVLPKCMCVDCFPKCVCACVLPKCVLDAAEPEQPPAEI